MASYSAKIPSEIPATQNFDAVNGEVADAMTGIAVAAAGDERMADFFSLAQDEVFKACTEPREILQKLSDGASLGRLCVDHGQWNVSISRHFPKRVEDDCSIPLRDHYSVTVTLKSYPHFNNEARKLADHASWLAPLEPPMWGNRVCENWGSRADLLMLYRIPIPDVLAFLLKLGLGENQNLEAYGEVQEKVEFKRFSVDLKRFGFRGCYSVYPEWPPHFSTNYQADSNVRFCTMVDLGSPGVSGFEHHWRGVGEPERSTTQKPTSPDRNNTTLL